MTNCTSHAEYCVLTRLPAAGRSHDIVAAVKPPFRRSQAASEHTSSSGQTSSRHSDGMRTEQKDTPQEIITVVSPVATSRNKVDYSTPTTTCPSATLLRFQLAVQVAVSDKYHVVPEVYRNLDPCGLRFRELPYSAQVDARKAQPFSVIKHQGKKHHKPIK